MDVATLAAGVLKVGSLSGLAAFGWQLWNAREARRTRLQITAARSADRNLAVVVKFAPHNLHQGVEARISMIEPVGAKVAANDRVAGERALRDHIRDAVGQLQATSKTVAKLARIPSDPSGVLIAELVVQIPEDAPRRATLRVEIWTAGYPRRLDARVVKLSPID